MVNCAAVLPMPLASWTGPPMMLTTTVLLSVGVTKTLNRSASTAEKPLTTPRKTERLLWLKSTTLREKVITSVIGDSLVGSPAGVEKVIEMGVVSSTASKNDPL